MTSLWVDHMMPGWYSSIFLDPLNIWSMKRTVSLTTIIIVLQCCLNYYSLCGRYGIPGCVNRRVGTCIDGARWWPWGHHYIFLITWDNVFKICLLTINDLFLYCILKSYEYLIAILLITMVWISYCNLTSNHGIWYLTVYIQHCLGYFC